MSSGKRHDLATIATAMLITKIGISLITIGRPFYPLFLIAGGCFFGLWLSPDLDLPHCNARKRWGVLQFIWTPYDRFFKHRSFASHFPIIGTGLRLIYLLVVPVVLLFVFLPSLFYLIVFNFWDSFGWIFCGLIITDSIHWIMDGCPCGKLQSKVKKQNSKKQNSN